VNAETYQWLKERSCEKNRKPSACGTVCHEYFPLDTLRADRHQIRIYFQTSYNWCGNCLSLCSDVTELHETGKPNLESDFSDCEGKLLCGISEQSAGRYDGKIAEKQKVRNT